MASKLSLDRVSQAIKDFRLPKLFLAGFWIRFLAFLFDVLVIKAIQAILLNLTLYRLFSPAIQDSFWVSLVELVIFVLYFFLTTLFFKGQTPGKILFDLRVISLSSEENDFKVYLFREFFGKVLFYYFPYIAVLLVFSEKNQHLIDFLVDTTVIRESRLEEVNQYLSQGGNDQAGEESTPVTD